MTETRVFCDKCRSPILDGRSKLVVECGPVRQADRPQIDLCSDCGDGLLDWLRSGAKSVSPRDDL